MRYYQTLASFQKDVQKNMPKKIIQIHTNKCIPIYVFR